MNVMGLRLRAMNARERSVDFVASTDAIDSYDEVVDQKSWRLDRYKSNPVVLYAHNSRELPIGHAKNLRVEDGQLQCSIHFVDEKANPLAEQVWNSIEQGSLRAVSVGFVPNTVKAEKRDGKDIFVLSDCDLHEISVVPIPANEESLAKMRARAMDQRARAQGENTMTVEELQGRIKALETADATTKAAIALADAKVVDLSKELATTRAVVTAHEGTIKALETDRDAHKERATKAEAAIVERDVDALVGVKIAPTEKSVFVELARFNRKLFDEAVAARPDMKLLKGQVIAGEQSTPPGSTAAAGNGSELSAKIFGNG